MFSRLGIKGKIFGMCALIALFVVGIGISGIRTLHHVVEKYEHVATTNMPNIQSLGDWNGNYRRARLYVALLGSPEVTAEQSAKFVEEVEASIAAGDKALAKYTSIPFGPGEEEVYKPVAALWDDVKVHCREAVEAFKKQDRKKFTATLLGDLVAVNAKFAPAMKTLVTFHEDDAKNSVADAHATTAFDLKLSIALMAVAFILAMALGFFFARSLSKSLLEIAESLMTDAEKVATGSGQIASAAEQLSASTIEQAAALQETAASIEEMSAMVTKNSENCVKSKDVANESHSSATQGRKIVEDMILAIGEIQTSNNEMTTEIEKSNQEISDIIKVIAEIGNKTKVINDIVFQTKLLSFNASVEAARAGEHGKGFAVVAEEVGNLAQMSGNASREISTMLESSIAKVESIVNNTKTRVERLVASGREKVNVGSVTAKKCGEVLDSIVANVESVNHLVGEIATASTEQDHGVKEASKAMSQMDQATQQNSSATQQTASSAESLSTRASALRATANLLVTTVQGAEEKGAKSVTKKSASASSARSTSNTRKPSSVSRPAQAEHAASPKVVSISKNAPTSAASAEAIPSSNDPRFEDIA